MSEEFKKDFTEVDAAKFLCRLCRDNERQAFASHRLAEQALSNAHNDNATRLHELESDDFIGWASNALPFDELRLKALSEAIDKATLTLSRWTATHRLVVDTILEKWAPSK